MKTRKIYFTFLCFFLVAIATAQPPVKIAVWGDSRENLDDATDQIGDILLHERTDWDVQVHTGDFTSSGKESDWLRSLKYPGMDSLYVAGKFLMCTSNHDAMSPESRSAWERYTLGVLPANDVDNTTHFSSWQKGNVHVVTCDAYFTDSLVMQKWLDEYVKTVPDSEWVVGVWHDPDYAGITYKKSYLAKSRGWLQTLSKHQRTIILHGHAHVYVRTRPLAADGALDTLNGIVHIVNGTGGASWEGPIKPDGRIAYTPAAKSFPCITFLTFTNDAVSMQTIDARPGKKRQVIDTFVLKAKQVDPK